MAIPRHEAEFGLYAEEILKARFGATLVDSYDCSNYEGATHVVDLGKPFVPEKQYDTIIDFGTVEHIFDVSQALQNLSALCSSGGQLLHVVPANNFCGHGFWQFSPELFFSLYSQGSGYAETEVFLADLEDPAGWFEVQRPSNGKRAEVVSNNPLYVMCRTVKVGDRFPQNVQQSDYMYLWGCDAYKREHQSELGPTVRKMIKSKPFLHRFAIRSLVVARRTLNPITNPTSLSNRNRHLRKLSVSDLLIG